MNQRSESLKTMAKYTTFLLFMSLKLIKDIFSRNFDLIWAYCKEMNRGFVKN